MKTHSAPLVCALFAAIALGHGAVRAQGPTIDVFDGLTQSFGTLGQPQRWVNVLGNVSDPDGVASLTFRLNGGPEEPLSIGPDTRRLWSPGDFNVEIDSASLLQGSNTVAIRATDSLGNASTANVSVTYDRTSVWPRNYAIDWSSVTDLADVVQIVDGRWQLEPEGIRPSILGYDRTFVLGDVSWRDFEVKMPITIHGIDPAGFNFPSVRPGLGFVARWTGHTTLVAGEQPHALWLPQGGGPWYDAGTDRLQLLGWDGLTLSDPLGRRLTWDVTYWWKMRAESVPGGSTFYAFKLWEDGTPEPADWQMRGTEGPQDLQNGAVIVVAHHVDATFGDIEVRDLEMDAAPPIVSQVQVVPFGEAATILWQTDEPASSTVSFGQTPGLELGSASSLGRVTEHRVRLTGLAPGTTYYYEIESVDGRGNVAQSGAATFMTTDGAFDAVLVTDSFDGPALDEKTWQVVDPRGDAGFSVSGGRLSIQVPSTQSHDLWTQGNTLARVMRPMTDDDFDVQVKFDSPLSLSFQSQGILAQQAPDTFVMADLRRQNDRTRLFVASFDNNRASMRANLDISADITTSTAPMWLRVDRARDRWSITWSTDGVTWRPGVTFQFGIAIGSIGVYAGNSVGVTHTAVVDEFVVHPPDVDSPVISNLRVIRGATAARLTWETDEPATSVVEFGTTAGFGSVESVETLVENHSLVLDGLAPDTTYHFRVGAEDAPGNLAWTGDATFTTASAGNESGLVSDHFDGNAFDPGVWEFVNPLGDALVQVQDSRLVLSVPATSEHDVWTDKNEVPRLVQYVLDEDFEVEVRFDSALTTNIQTQGILVEQDPSRLIRVEFQRVNGSHRLFVASIFGTTVDLHLNTVIPAAVPMVLRVGRTGDNWTVAHSADGMTWQTDVTFFQAMTVSRVGPYAGNSVGVAHDAIIDYFSNTASPPPDTRAPIISDVRVAATDQYAVVEWRTDEPASSRVEFGATAGLGSSAGSPALVRSHSVTLTGLAQDTLYHFRVVSSDGSANSSQSSIAMFETAEQGNFAGIRSDDFSDPARSDRLWNFVNPLGDGTSAVSDGKLRMAVPASQAHEMWTNARTMPRMLQGVVDADFEIQVGFTSALTESFQSQGVLVEQDNAEFLRIEFHRFGTQTRLFVADIAATGARILLSRSISPTGPMHLRVRRDGDEWLVSYSLDGAAWVDGVAFVRPMDVAAIGPMIGNTLGTAHQAEVDYFFNTMFPPPDVTPPTIGGIHVSAATGSATVSWETDELATSIVDFGTSSAYSQTASVSGTRRQHAVTLTGLIPDTTYHFMVRSADVAGNEATSGDSTFRTPANGGPSGIVSDDFVGPALDSNVWSIVDPLGDSTFSMTGSQLSIRIPAGARHDVWTDIDTAPRIVQRIIDADFDVAARFDSPLTASFQSQGIYVAEDSNSFLRIELHHSDGKVRLFGAAIEKSASRILGYTTVPIAAPMWLRLERTGASWVVRYSRDGRTWLSGFKFSSDLVVREIGPFGGNSVGVAHTVLVDFFHDVDHPPADASPPIISDVSVSRGAESATVRWTTNEPATSSLDYGLTASYSASAGDAALVTQHALTITGLLPSTPYHFRVSSADATANSATTADATFVTAAAGNLSGLTSDEFDGSTLDTSRWTFVNPLGDASVAMTGSAVEMTAPAGMAHDLWSTTDTVPKLLQSPVDADFEVEAKFDSALTDGFRSQGIVVRGDPSTSLRMEFHVYGGQSRLFVARVAAGASTVIRSLPLSLSPPMYLRVGRAGDQWTVSYSLDGSIWSTGAVFSEAIRVSGVGPFVGGGSATTHVARIDYFRNVRAP